LKRPNAQNESQDEKVQNRLFKLGEIMKEKREKMRREIQENIANEYSFTPEINETSKHLALKYENAPIHERVINLLLIVYSIQKL